MELEKCLNDTAIRETKKMSEQMNRGTKIRNKWKSERERCLAQTYKGGRIEHARVNSSLNGIKFGQKKGCFR